MVALKYNQTPTFPPFKRRALLFDPFQFTSYDRNKQLFQYVSFHILYTTVSLRITGLKMSSNLFLIVVER